MIFAFLGPQVGRFWDVFGKKNAVLRGVFHQSMIFSREKTPFGVFFLEKNAFFGQLDDCFSRKNALLVFFFEKNALFGQHAGSNLAVLQGKMNVFFVVWGPKKSIFWRRREFPGEKKATFSRFL